MVHLLRVLRPSILFTILAFYSCVVCSQHCSDKCFKPLPGNQTPNSRRTFTIISGGIERSYIIYIPPGYYERFPALTPVILSYHGGNRSALDQLELDQFTNPEFNRVEIVVYPMSVGPKGDPTWQGTPSAVPGVNDVLFTEDLIDHLISAYCIDEDRIYATGKSDGAGFCNVLACDHRLSKRIAAFAPVSGAFYVNTSTCDAATVTISCKPGRKAIPIIEFHGGNDTTISYNGGSRKNECLPTIPHWTQEWAKREGLSTNNNTWNLTSDTKVYQFGSGWDTGLITQLFDVSIGHDWPSTQPNSDNIVQYHHPASFNATPMIMDFFGRYALNTQELLGDWAWHDSWIRG